MKSEESRALRFSPSFLFVSGGFVVIGVRPSEGTEYVAVNSQWSMSINFSGQANESSNWPVLGQLPIVIVHVELLSRPGYLAIATPQSNTVPHRLAKLPVG